MSTFSRQFYEAIHVNNASGVYFLQHQRNGDAISCFYKALNALIHALGEPDSALAAGIKEKMANAGDLQCKRVLTSVEIPDWKNDSYDDAYVLFNRALCLSLTPIESMDDWDQYHLLMSTLLIYNLGLAHHLEGLHRGDSRILAKALNLYAVAYNTLCEDKTAPPSLCSLAVSNNMGHIFAYFHNLDEAANCRDELSIRFATQVSASYSSPLSSISEEERRIFMLNICFFEKSTLQAPAA